MPAMKKIMLFCNSSGDYSIQDAEGKKYTLDEARDAWVAQRVYDCNQSFRRLATQFNFDVLSLKAFYANPTS